MARNWSIAFAKRRFSFSVNDMYKFYSMHIFIPIFPKSFIGLRN